MGKLDNGPFEMERNRPHAIIVMQLLILKVNHQHLSVQPKVRRLTFSTPIPGYSYHDLRINLTIRSQAKAKKRAWPGEVNLDEGNLIGVGKEPFSEEVEVII